jgi:4-hydroxy-3-methylbut-2-enyl diphosphate reductase
LVTKVHVEVGKMRNQAREVVMIGHKGHPEVEGTMGQSEDGMYLVETRRMSRSCKVNRRSALLRHPDHTVGRRCNRGHRRPQGAVSPEVQGPKKDDICYATQNRQDAVKALAEQCDLVIVVGSPNSSNSRRLKEVALARGRCLGLSGLLDAGASAPSLGF